MPQYFKMQFSPIKQNFFFFRALPCKDNHLSPISCSSCEAKCKCNHIFFFVIEQSDVNIASYCSPTVFSHKIWSLNAPICEWYTITCSSVEDDLSYTVLKCSLQNMHNGQSTSKEIWKIYVSTTFIHQMNIIKYSELLTINTYAR